VPRRLSPEAQRRESRRALRAPHLRALAYLRAAITRLVAERADLEDERERLSALPGTPSRLTRRVRIAHRLETIRVLLGTGSSDSPLVSWAYRRAAHSQRWGRLTWHGPDAVDLCSRRSAVEQARIRRRYAGMPRTSSLRDHDGLWDGICTVAIDGEEERARTVEGRYTPGTWRSISLTAWQRHTRAVARGIAPDLAHASDTPLGYARQIRPHGRYHWPTLSDAAVAYTILAGIADMPCGVSPPHVAEAHQAIGQTARLAARQAEDPELAARMTRARWRSDLALEINHAMPVLIGWLFGKKDIPSRRGSERSRRDSRLARYLAR